MSRKSTTIKKKRCFLLDDDKPLLKRISGETRKTNPIKKGGLDSDFQGMYEKTDRESDFF